MAFDGADVQVMIRFVGNDDATLPKPYSARPQ